MADYSKNLREVYQISRINDSSLKLKIDDIDFNKDAEYNKEQALFYSD